MKHRRLPIMGLLAFVLLVGCTSKSKDTISKVAVEEQVEQNANEGWKMLFNGHNFEGWKSISSDQTPKYGWKIENKELIVEESNGGESLHGGDIITQKKYSDFELKWEWKMNTVGGNSGLKYYVNSSGKNNAKHGIGLEYQILDDPNHPWMLEGKMEPNDYHTTGACYELYAPSTKKNVSPLGEWNSSRIVSMNGQIEHWLNGEKIVEFDRFSSDFNTRVSESKFNNLDRFGQQESGHILLQDHGGNVHFRNIEVKEL
ncbi:MAG: DUF1080 domain-containing protein [Bacteroidota bacterium]